MNVGKNNKIKREDDGEISIGTQDTYSQRSLTTQEDDEYKEDSFLLIETGNSEMGDDENSFLDIKRDYLRRKKNLNKKCCRRTLEYNEDYFLMKINEKELEMAKLEKKHEDNFRNKKNDEILCEIRKCKAAIKKISKHKMKVYLNCNREGGMETRWEE